MHEIWFANIKYLFVIILEGNWAQSVVKSFVCMTCNSWTSILFQYFFNHTIFNTRLFKWLCYGYKPLYFSSFLSSSFHLKYKKSFLSLHLFAYQRWTFNCNLSIKNNKKFIKNENEIKIIQTVTKILKIIKKKSTCQLKSEDFMNF